MPEVEASCDRTRGTGDVCMHESNSAVVEEYVTTTRIAPELYQCYKYEANRLRTYSQWPQTVEGLCLPSVTQLANAGFYYTGHETTVRCFECALDVSHWSSDDIPIDRHRQLRANCPFVQRFCSSTALVAGVGLSPVADHSRNVSNRNGVVDAGGDHQHLLINTSDDSGNTSDSSPMSCSPTDTTSTGRSSGVSSLSGDECEEQHSQESHLIYNRTENMTAFRRLMKSECNRLKTFYVNGQSLWPQSTCIREEELARAGFYYVQDDQVQCAFCTGLIRCWRPGLRPLEEHSKHFPLCPFVMEEDVGNVAIGSDPVRDPQPVVGHDVCGSGRTPATHTALAGDVLNTRHRDGGRTSPSIDVQSLGIQLYTGPKHPEMGPIENRRKTFQPEYGWKSDTPVSADTLAEAGFYYIGSTDAVICFHCDGGLCEWESGDDPWVEHAKSFPNCNFLKLNKSQSYIDECTHKTTGPTPAPGASTPSSTPPEEDPVVHACHVVDQWLNSELVHELRQMNAFSLDVIKVALNRRYHSCRAPFESFAQLYNAVHDLSENRLPSAGQQPTSTSVTQAAISTLSVNTSSNDNQIIHPIDDSPPMSSTFMTSLGPTMTTARAQTVSTGSEPSSSQQKTSENASETRLSCKICFLSEIEVVFLPCGHQLACGQCAQRLTDCPVCRQPIKGFVRTFFS